MNLTELLLLQTAEECAEIAQIVSKSMRFGLAEVNCLEPDGPDNRARLVGELNDLVAMTRLLVLNGILPDDWLSQEAQNVKIAKVMKFARYSGQLGILDNCRIKVPAELAEVKP